MFDKPDESIYNQWMPSTSDDPRWCDTHACDMKWECSKCTEDILLSLIASLTLCDHMRDVANDVKMALKRAGITVEWEDLYELRLALGRMGISTLSGVKLSTDGP